MKILVATLASVLCCLFYASFKTDMVHFSNDGPFGGMAAQQNELPGVFFGTWNDLNWLGGQTPPPSIGPSAGLRMACWHLTTGSLFLLIICSAALLRWLHRKQILLPLT